MDEVCWKVVAAKRCGNGFKAKTSKRLIFTRELPNVKSLEVLIESIPGLLIFDNQLLDDAANGGKGSLSRERETA